MLLNCSKRYLAKQPILLFGCLESEGIQPNRYVGTAVLLVVRKVQIGPAPSPTPVDHCLVVLA